ncbi:DEAD/DEAH box helicase [Leptothermofonsia sp. ETS-13]|uniref:DEAD/DEAH box helicase n=1 Tax=Leptothermofonsia sp. ETS-13 TaxID=3035696 RepID=UPI003BA1794C
MAILHGSWLLQPQRYSSDDNQATGMAESSSASEYLSSGSEYLSSGCLFIWGETWRRITPDMLEPRGGTEESLLGAVLTHPFAMTVEELLDFLRSQQQAGSLRLPPDIWELSLMGQSTGRRSRSAASSRTKSTSASPTPTESSTSRWRQQGIAVPSYLASADGDTAARVVIPQHSAASSTDAEDSYNPLFLHPWQVEGICLSPAEAITFLNSLPLGAMNAGDSFLGGDLRYWSHIARWSLDLLARSKFLPGLERYRSNDGQNANDRFLARWQPLLDSAADQSRLNRFLEQMPAACRLYQQATEGCDADSDRPPLAVNLPIDPQTLLQDFLSKGVDAQIRALVGNYATTATTEKTAGRASAQPAIESPVWEWLKALGPGSGVVEATDLDGLQTALTHWMAPLQMRGFEQSLFRTCLYLHPPQPGQTNWMLEYFLQAADDPEFLVSASVIWSNPVERLIYQGRAIAHPQETFLMGLGLASRLYPVIEPSLQEARPQFCQLTPLQAYDFLKTVTWRLQDSGLGVVVPPSLASEGGWASRLGLKIQAQTAKSKKGDRLGLQSLLNFRWELSIGGQTLSKEEFDRLVALNTPLVEINGEWVELRSQDIRAAQAFFASRKDQTALSLEDALRISTGDTQMIEKLPVVSFEASGSLQELINTISGKRTLEPIATPTSFRGELRPYQSRGVGWLAFLEQWGLGACLADDMGLGKTIQLIAFLLHLKEKNTLEAPTLLVCPTSVLGNWEREVKKFGPTLKVLLHHGDGRPKGKAFARAVQGKDLIITSYALIHRDLPDLQSVSWQNVVLDEAQNIKNPDAKQSQAVRQLEAPFRIALTGTPVENRLTELWSIMDFLNPGYLGPKNFFQRRFATPIERYGDTDSLKTLRSLVQPFILRRLKTDRDIIQDLPDKQEMTVFCGLTAEQAALYQNVVEQSLAEIEETEGIQRKGIILALLVKLKQICNHPALFLKESGVRSEEWGVGRGEMEVQNSGLGTQNSFDRRSGKLQRLEEMLEEVVLEGDRALIFTQFAEWGKLLKAHLERRLEQEVLFLYGSTPKKQREEMVDRFQHDPQAPRIFILSLKAGGVGLNLTRANHVFHFDRWWNPAVENQATDRVFRIGQTRNVQVHKFVCNGTLEEKIHDLIESKKALAENVVGAGENWLTELDTDSLRNLLLLDRSAIIGEE